MSPVLTQPPLSRARHDQVPAPRPEAHLSQRTRETLVGAAVALGGLVVLVMWARDTALLHTLGERLTAAGRITGLVGTYLVLVEVLLMGRIPWLDRLIGMDRLAVWHRRVGEYSIGLLVAHALLIIWGYGLTSHQNLFKETGSVVLTYPDMLAATVGLAALVAVGVTSARAARRRLKYQTWYFIHLYVYVALALSFAHQLATGADFATEPLNRALWVAMYVGAAGLLLYFRLIVPIWKAWRHQLRVAQIVEEAPGTFSIYVTGRWLDELRADAGQFFLWRFLTRSGWWQAHPFSLSAAPNGSWLRLTVKVLGDHSRQLTRLRPGTRVIAEGPYGAFTEGRRTRRKVLLVGAGVGIAPLRALFESLPARPGDLTLLYRARHAEDLAFRAELDHIAAERGGRVIYLTGSRQQRPNPLSAPGLRAVVGASLPLHEAYVCGPPELTEDVVAALRQAGIPRRHIHAEKFEL